MKYSELPKFAEFMITALLSNEMKEEKQPIKDSVHESGDVDMDFKINNISIDPLYFFTRLEQAFDYRVNKKAYELITEKFDTEIQAFDDYHYLKRQLNKKLCETLNIPMEEE